jgi:hypothetical protein
MKSNSAESLSRTASGAENTWALINSPSFVQPLETRPYGIELAMFCNPSMFWGGYGLLAAFADRALWPVRARAPVAHPRGTARFAVLSSWQAQSVIDTLTSKKARARRRILTYGRFVTTCISLTGFSGFESDGQDRHRSPMKNREVIPFAAVLRRPASKPGASARYLIGSVIAGSRPRAANRIPFRPISGAILIRQAAVRSAGFCTAPLCPRHQPEIQGRRESSRGEAHTARRNRPKGTQKCPAHACRPRSHSVASGRFRALIEPRRRPLACCLHERRREDALRR